MQNNKKVEKYIFIGMKMNAPKCSNRTMSINELTTMIMTSIRTWVVALLLQWLLNIQKATAMTVFLRNVASATIEPLTHEQRIRIYLRYKCIFIFNPMAGKLFMTH